MKGEKMIKNKKRNLEKTLDKEQQEPEQETMQAEYPKEVLFTRKAILVDEALCKTYGKSCEAIREIKNEGNRATEGYKCDLFGIDLFWRGRIYDGYKNEVERCEECLKQEREQSHE